ncbi:MAG TPA: hypothetical protein VMX16_09430 [Terriglobia bacterium]|nr:hypothetical protein [Terriglobia bacterium]
MLAIRPDQLQKFSEAAVKRFEDQMVIHLNKFFPKQCKAAGETKLRETIQYGVKRATAYRITRSSDVCKYIDLMLVFGRDFDQSPQQAWAGEILDSKSVKGPVRRMALLFETAKKHCGLKKAGSETQPS